jgi:radical SAM protein with 4Fe4S-binding SPASM domain
MHYAPETRLALDPQLFLKNDVDRAVIITRSRPLAEREDILRRVHPAEAIILALLDGERTVGEAGEVWTELTGKPPATGVEEVGRVIDYYTSGGRARDRILIAVDDSTRESIRKYDPADFVIPAWRINLTDRRLRIPYNVYYLPTLFCPQRCVYCYARTSPRPEIRDHLLSVDRLRELLTELRSLGVDSIQLSGGDVFARPDIFDILAAITTAGLATDIPTKLGLSYEDALRLQELGIDTIQVSLDSAEPEVLDHMVGVHNYHRRAFRLLTDLQRARLKVRVNAVLTPANVPTVGALIDFLGKLGHVNRLTLTPYGRSLFCHQDALFVEQEHLDQVEAEIALRRGLYPHMAISVGSRGAVLPEDHEERQRQWEGRAFCSANRSGFVILPDGRVTVCEELYDHPDFIIGDLKVQSVMEMWNSPEALALIHPDQAAVPRGACKVCPDFAECNAVRGRCWRDVLKSYGWDNSYYPDPRCPRAPQGNRLG